MDRQQILDYYSRPDIQQALLKVSAGREVAGVYETGAYTKRPGALIFPTDLTAFAKSGVIEFHGSLERWSNPVSIKEGNYNELRIGWDIVLDLDCELFEHGRIAALVISRELKKFGVNNLSVKFTGGTGFHLGLSWKSLPKKIDYKSSVNQFPDLARKVAAFLKTRVRDELEKGLLKKYNPEELAQQTGKPLGKIMAADGINPFEIVDIDPILLSARHLFRLPYSINMKKFRVSVPVKIDNLQDFRQEDAVPEKITGELGFLDQGEEGELDLLIGEALDFSSRTEKTEKIVEKRRNFEIKDPIKQDIFPPCIKNISAGLTDGRKRGVFILINFLKSAKWAEQGIEKYISEWNQKNSPPLPESYIRSQLRWHLNKDKALPPPNCPSEKSVGWYDTVCKPDRICGTPKIVIKNPISYPIKIMSSYKPKAPQKKGHPSKRKIERNESWDSKETI